MDSEKPRSDDKMPFPDTSEEGVPESVAEAPDPKIVRKLRLKIDFVILPLLVIMYTFKYVPGSVPCSSCSF